MALYNAPIERIAIENPMGIMSGGNYIKKWFPDLAEKYGLPIRYTQVIHPHYFGDKSRKQTCLWLKNLPPLVWAKQDTLFEKSQYVNPVLYTTKSGKTFSKDYMVALSAGKDRAKLRSKTYPGIAQAIATQWGGYLLEQE